MREDGYIVLFLQGGLSTSDEMCLSFFFYYPRLKFTAGLSHIDDNVFYSFLGNFPWVV